MGGSCHFQSRLTECCTETWDPVIPKPLHPQKEEVPGKQKAAAQDKKPGAELLPGSEGGDVAGARPRKPASWGPCPASRSELPDRPVMWAPNASCVSSVQFSNSCIKKVKKQRVKLIFKNTFQLTLCIQTTILTCNRYLTSWSYFTSSCYSAFDVWCETHTGHASSSQGSHGARGCCAGWRKSTPAF